MHECRWCVDFGTIQKYASSMRLVRRAFANLRLQRIPEVWADFELARRAVQRLGKILESVCARWCYIQLHQSTQPGCVGSIHLECEASDILSHLELEPVAAAVSQRRHQFLCGMV